MKFKLGRKQKVKKIEYTSISVQSSVETTPGEVNWVITKTIEPQDRNESHL